MNWEEASEKIRKQVSKGLKLDKMANYGRPVLEVPPYACASFNNEEGYKIKIGSDRFIEVPMSMLKACYEAAMADGGIYKTSIIYSLYPEQVKETGGYVHVVGNIFQVAGLGVKVKGGYELV